MASTRSPFSWWLPSLAAARTYLAGAAMNIYYVAAIWLGMALLATMISIRIAVPAALVEIVVGALAGNIPGIREHVPQTDVVVFLGSVGSLVLTFLAGAEIDPVSLRGHWKASLSIGAVSFALPFLAAFGFCGLVLGWSLHAADRWHRAEHHLGGRGVCGDGRDRAEPSRPRQAHPGRLLHHRLGHGAGPGWPVRQLRLAAVGVRGGQRGHRGAAAPVAAAGDQIPWPPGIGARDQAAAGGPVRPGRPGHPGGQ